MKKFYLLFLAVLFAFASGQATKVEIHTDIFGNQSWESVELPETNGSYVLTKEVKTNGQFGIKIDGTWYAAPNSGPVEISLDTPFKVQNGDHQNAEFNLGAGEYTFTFSLDAKELTVSKSYHKATQLYFLHNFDGNWNEADAPAMTETAPGSGVFTSTLDVTASDGHYFSFTETKGGWYNETRYGPYNDGTEAFVNQTTTDVNYKFGNSWNLKSGGKLTFTIDTNEAHRSLTISEGNTVYFRNTKGWEHIYLTTYDEASDMYGTNYKWTPEMFQQYQDQTTYGDRNTGVEITDNPTVSINGEEWIKVVLPADAKHFVFHNGQNPGK